MAVVRNQRDFQLGLTSGRMLNPGSTANVDITLPLEAAYVTSGALLVVDGSVDPPAPAEPFAGALRRTFVAAAQPAALKPGDLWFKTHAETHQVLDVLEMT